MCVRNRRSRADETRPRLLTTRANWSRTAAAGTGSAGECATDFPDGEDGVGTCLSPQPIILQKLLLRYGQLTSAYVRSEATQLSVESGGVRESMQNYRQTGTVIFVSSGSPEATVEQDIEAHGLVMQWARTIDAAASLLVAHRLGGP